MTKNQTDSKHQAGQGHANADAQSPSAHASRQSGKSQTPSSDKSQGRPKLADHEDSKVPGVADKPTHSGYEEKQGDAHGNTKRGS